MPNESPVLECAIPVLQVSDLRQSIDFYKSRLGFTVEWGDEEGSTVCSVTKDGCSIMLSQVEGPPSPSWVWLGMTESPWEVYKRRGLKVKQEPKNFSWAYEMKFEDPDGNVLWVGTGPRKDLPLEDG